MRTSTGTGTLVTQLERSIYEILLKPRVSERGFAITGMFKNRCSHLPVALRSQLPRFPRRLPRFSLAQSVGAANCIRIIIHNEVPSAETYFCELQYFFS